ncbi:MAG: diacylglycerol kinase family lipid kinase, partial [Chloroflexi bacterium]|nr:diacylglycerol kinase family lipid kinase [Chloroflexota bacterium]
PRDWRCATTGWPGHARELARTAAADGCERVIAVGGDGTVSQIANGLLGTDCALGIIPAGTGNDFPLALGIPADPGAAAMLAFAGTPRLVDVGEIRTADHSGHFVNVASYGFDAEVARRAREERLNGSHRYLVAVLRTLRVLHPRVVRLEVDGRPIERHLLLIAVANGPRYGGGLRIAPDAAPDDGHFDVCLVRGLSVAAVLGLLPRVYWGGHRHHPAVELLRCRLLQVASAVPMAGQADGEPLGALPARFTLLPGALQCVAPARRTGA